MNVMLNNQPIQDGQVLLARQLLTFSYQPPPGVQPVLLLTTSNLVRPVPTRHATHELWYWHWHPLDYTGVVHVSLLHTQAEGQVPVGGWQVQVLPQHLDQQHYQRLLEDLHHTAQGLLYTLGHSTVGAGLATEPPADPATRPNPLEAACAFVQVHLAALEQIVAQLADPPPALRQTLLRRTDTAHARRFDRLASFDLRPSPSQHTLPALPAHVYETIPAHTPDGAVLGLVRHLLDRLWEYSHTFREILFAARIPLSHPLLQQLNHAYQRLQYLRQQPHFAEAVPRSEWQWSSQQMQYNPLYRQIYQCWQALRQPPTLSLAAPQMQLPIHDLPRLYEYWCVLQVLQAITQLEGIQIHTQQLFRPAPPSAWQLRFATDAPLLTAQWHATTLRLWYQPRYTPTSTPYTSLDHQTHIPDLVLEQTRPEQPPRLLVLDAKYRLDPQGNIPAAAFSDAYTYLGSIGTADGQRIVAAVLLLYPGLSGALLRYASGVGTVALLPAQTDGLRRGIWAMLTS